MGHRKKEGFRETAEVRRSFWKLWKERMGGRVDMGDHQEKDNGAKKRRGKGRFWKGALKGILLSEVWAHGCMVMSTTEMEQSQGCLETVYKGHPDVPKLFPPLLVPSTLIFFISHDFHLASDLWLLARSPSGSSSRKASLGTRDAGRDAGSTGGSTSPKKLIHWHAGCQEVGPHASLEAWELANQWSSSLSAAPQALEGHLRPHHWGQAPTESDLVHGPGLLSQSPLESCFSC